ncbi:hypothetical protein Poly21_50650 [Allorhodopirellula heiligendammensis]|uniref:Glycoside hydrolase 123 C-terminal domain-containing protein n=1 Tax=Allorhodopirellula heiligendammensis TaxID=2714739 RepID=A0A5C6BFL0_9BACT|nr:hypothetical protein Poly21_50650 [Allorhodopirellula heiligendammensis]
MQGEQQTILIRDLPEGSLGRDHLDVKVIARSCTGQHSEAEAVRIPLRRMSSPIGGAINDTGEPAKADASISRVSVIPVADKYDIEGQPVGDLPEGYRHRNSTFNGERIRLSAAAGEVISFQMLLRGERTVSLELALDSLQPRVDWFEAVYVSAHGRRIPDPLLPVGDSITLTPDQDSTIVADIYVPFDAKPGMQRGTVQVSDGRVIPIEIEILPFAIPRAASFFCEMNGYGLPDSVEQYEALQQIAYDHRVHVNILHYSHHTAAPGAHKTNLDMRMRSGRRMDNRRYDDIEPRAKHAYWDDFATAFGPYLDGSLFENGHRGPIPAPGFYLSFHESWPLNCRAYYNGDADAYRAFEATPEYADTYVNVLSDFVELAQSRGWNDTGFQIYFNNKGSREELTKAPWILDEPASYWDYRALRYYGGLTDVGRERESSQWTPGVKIDFRIDISRPEFCRGQLDGRDDLWVVSASAFEKYRRLLTDRADRDGLRVWVYGSANHVHQSNRDIQAWSLDAWSGGATGVVPWQTINKDGQALVEADQFGLFIFDQGDQGIPEIRHSMRLKAFRDAQQLIEYLNLLQARKGWTRTQRSAFVQQFVGLAATVVQTHEADAGTSQYPGVKATEWDRLRQATANLLRE